MIPFARSVFVQTPHKCVHVGWVATQPAGGHPCPFVSSNIVLHLCYICLYSRSLVDLPGCYCVDGCDVDGCDSNSQDLPGLTWQVNMMLSCYNSPWAVVSVALINCYPTCHCNMVAVVTAVESWLCDVFCSCSFKQSILFTTSPRAGSATQGITVPNCC